MSQSDSTAPKSSESLPPPQVPAGDTHMESNAKLENAVGPPPSPKGGISKGGKINWRKPKERKGNWHEPLQATTDIVQAVCQVALVVLGIYGYVYTILPVFNKATLENQIAAYRTNLLSSVARLFLTDVVSKAEQYKCSPTVYDTGSGQVHTFPPAVTGTMLVEGNLNDPAFDLLPASDRAALDGKIRDFVAHHTPADELASALQIQHFAALTGPLNVATASSNQNPFKFCQADVPISKQAFQLFGRGLTALQATLTTDQLPSIQFSACPDLGQLPKCPSTQK
jgi:hypothetical protein